MPTQRFAERAKQILLEAHAIIENDHFVYDSGEHGSGWIDKDAVDEHPDWEEELCRMLGESTRDLAPEVVCGPATGGLIVAQWVAHALGAMAVFAEHDPASTAASGGPVRQPFVLRRGFDRIVRGRRVLVVDDVINTGLSIRQTVDVVSASGGTVVGAGALVTRGNASVTDLGVSDARWLLQVEIPSWPAVDCPLCKQGVPINVQYAHGAEYLAQRDHAH
ncbi:MAG TPA: phosphoribosyltransferase family protein [Thermomicrobiales bacterium]|nr:phosphoribosyltransferase family protein [Thermomicrobiales bacterium]